jgi:hypothetical protein
VTRFWNAGVMNDIDGVTLAVKHMLDEMARKISQNWEARGYQILYDHGSSPDENVGKIESWFGEHYNREAQLSQLDIAIVEENTHVAYVLIEIEETTDKPKTLLGDAFGTLMGATSAFAGSVKKYL